MTNKYTRLIDCCAKIVIRFPLRLYVILLCCLILIAGCNGHREEEETASTCPYEAIEKMIDKVKVQTAQQYQTLQLTGNVDYSPEQVYRYVPLLTGVVTASHFALGDYVRKGQVLMEIGSPEITEISASLAAAEIRLLTANRNLQSQQVLYKDGAASDRDVLEATVEASAIQSEIRKLKQSLQIYGGSLAQGQLVVKSEINGYVVEKNVVKGQQISPGEPLFVLGNLDKVWIYANVYAGNLSQIKGGQLAQISTTAWPGQVFKGRINRMSNVFDPEERVLKGVIELDNRQGKLKPGMMATINVHLDDQEEVVAVPLIGVIFDLDRYYVVKTSSACQYVIQEIHPLYQDSRFYYIAKHELTVEEALVGKNNLLVYNKLKGR